VPEEIPEPLLSTPRWAPFAVLGLVGSVLAFLFLRRRQKTEYISLDEIE
jgi:LPXTG-motif cell wall-anchored protein